MIRTALFYAVGAVAAVTMIAAGILTTGSEPTRAGALGGPVILGGDDMTAHGSVDGSGNVISGWLYIKNSLATLDANASRGDGSIAALGSAAAPETNGGDAGAAVGAAAQELGITVNYYNGDTAMTGFFDTLGSTANPSIIWLAGNDGSNDMSDGPGDEDAVLTANASALSSFVAGGGGLMSHGTNYGWLSALLPGATAVFSGGGNLVFTAEGSAAFPTLTEPDINAGPWHNHFEGNFGGLQVLVRDSFVLDALGSPAAVILGGAQVTFEEQPDAEEEDDGTDCTPGVPGLPCGNESGGSGGAGDYDSNPTDPTQPTAVAPTTVPDPAQPVATAPTGGAGAGGSGPITAPDTGYGPSDDATPWAMIAAITAVIGIAGAGMVLAGRRVR